MSDHGEAPRRPDSGNLRAKPYDFLVFIGRFQPFHLGHRAVIETALAQAGGAIVLVGSAFAPRSYRNPWSFDERRRMILESFPPEDAARIVVRALEDRLYNNNAWVQQVQEIVDDIVEERHDFATSPRIALIGHGKDNSSFYLKLFPQWGSVDVRSFNALAATPMREGVFSSIRDAWLHDAGAYLPVNVQAQLAEFAASADYQHILDEYLFIRGYRESWAQAPYAPSFVTTDAVVVQSGHVLLIERGARPGKGLLALPGGYLGIDDTIEESMIRELREETRIRVPDPVLRGHIVGSPRVFDDPHRDPRGRFITHAYLIALQPRREEGFKLPKVKGSDDAASARWVPQAEIRREDLFLDHYDIIQNMVSQL
jgi:bifunctional NMN adenylyltransferase/nudix hydrolase